MLDYRPTTPLGPCGHSDAHNHQGDTETMASTRTRVRPRLAGGERSLTGVRRRRPSGRPWDGRERGPLADERVPCIARALLAADVVSSCR